jgi:hypothetical protein
MPLVTPRPIDRLLPRIPPILRVLALPALRDASVVAALVTAVSLFAGAVRVMPVLLAPSVPSTLALPFARAALAVSLEVALFVAPPIGAALAAARLVDRGEARAIFALGVSPGSLALGAWPVWLLFAVLSALASASWGREAEAPGRLLSSLLAEGRVACVASALDRPDVPHAASVPLASASWVCLPGEPPRVVFDVPLLGGAALSARSIDLAPDTTSLSAEDLVIAVPETLDRGAHSVRVGRASIRGLVPLGRPSNLGALRRALLLGGSSSLGAALAGFAVLVFSLGGRALALAVGLVGPLLGLLGLSALERAPSPLLAYGIIPLAALLGPLVAARLGRVALRRGGSG